MVEAKLRVEARHREPVVGARLPWGARLAWGALLVWVVWPVCKGGAILGLIASTEECVVL